MVCTLIAAIRTLLPNLNGPTDSVRKLLRSVGVGGALCYTGMSQSPSNTEKQEHFEDVVNDRRKYEGKSSSITKKIIGQKACTFKNNKRIIDHYIMQILSGHGTFNEYRRTIRKETHSRCWDCVAEGDDAEHTLLSCPRWINERTLLENYVGEILTINNVIDLVVSSEENWVRFQGICRKIMIARQNQERNMEKRKRR
ncbi:uncharacterized protein LOC117211074 [Bombus bifarius]|uniref:Uncharacterized protein LOC117211074 n=1 Tax=Bombus bifarius TaxID=103933 RepID=A0A6P8N6Y1_9HYME|nr:uncharacterized protein LOC117211074 [Bombus bifarius]